jgi:sugar phosphate isomerase/epimerase
VKHLADQGYQNIELSGGTKYYAGWDDELLNLKKSYGLKYLLHNYFPPPREDFVLNLASQDPDIYQKSLDHILGAIEASSRLEANKFGFHAGYYVDPGTTELGKKFKNSEITEIESHIERFCRGYERISECAGNRVELYIENNILSLSNYETFGSNLFMLVTSEEYHALHEKIPFKLLLDVAHLKVSSATLKIHFEEELDRLVPLTDYIHVSDNDGFHDQNAGISSGSPMLNALKKFNFDDKVITIEVYEGMEAIKQTYQNVTDLL